MRGHGRPLPRPGSPRRALAGRSRPPARRGFPLAGTTVLFIVLSAAALAVSWPLLAPIIRSADAPLAKTLNLVYPALDLVLLVPAIVLLRITSRFRGGAVWHIWLALL